MQYFLSITEIKFPEKSWSLDTSFSKVFFLVFTVSISPYFLIILLQNEEILEIIHLITRNNLLYF